jgi:LPS-assembly protein
MYSYREFLRLKIEQSYDINEAVTDDPAERSNPDRREPFSPIFAELFFAPFPYFSLRADATHSVYEDDFESHNLALNVSDWRGDRLYLEHRYRRDSQETLYADLRLRITDRLTTYADWEKNLLDDRVIRSGVGFLYQTQCWALDAAYIREEDTSQVAFMVHFNGLGEISRRLLVEGVAAATEYE